MSGGGLLPGGFCPRPDCWYIKTYKTTDVSLLTSETRQSLTLPLKHTGSTDLLESTVYFH